jgi:hypothetical protein
VENLAVVDDERALRESRKPPLEERLHARGIGQERRPLDLARVVRYARHHRPRRVQLR